MRTPPASHKYLCDVVVGHRCFRLALMEDPNLEGWAYSVFDVDSNQFFIPESPVSDPETGKRCAEAVIRENFAFSPVQFNWRRES